MTVTPAADLTRLNRSSGQDCAANRRAPPILTLNIVLGAANGRVNCCLTSAALAIFSVDGPRPIIDPTVEPTESVTLSHSDGLGPSGLLRLPRRQGPRHPHLGVVGILRQRAHGELEGRDAVDERVMHLGVDRETAVLQAFDDVRLPQRAMPVQQGAVQPRHQLQQVAHPAWRRQRRPAQVVAEVEFVVERPADVREAAEQCRRVFTERRGDSR